MTHLAGREQKAIRNSVALVGEQFAEFSLLLTACLAQPKYVYVDTLAENVLHHNVRLSRHCLLEQLVDVLLL